MITLFTIFMIAFFFKMIGFAFRMAWGLTKVFFGIIILPVVLIGLVVFGLIRFAFTILLIVSVVMIIKSAFSDEENEEAVEMR